VERPAALGVALATPGTTDLGSILVVKVLWRRWWFDHAVLVAGTRAAGWTSRNDPVDTLRPV